MINLGEHFIESYAHILNVDKSVLGLNPKIEPLGYRFRWIDASEFEDNFSEILNVPKSNKRPLTIFIGRNSHGISHELHNAIIHTSIFSERFMYMEYPGLMLLQKIDDFKISGENEDYIIERQQFEHFYSFVSDLLLQLRLFKIGEIRCSQLFHITSISRQISWRKTEIFIGSSGDFKLNNEELKKLSDTLEEKASYNALTELAVKNFNLVYDIPDGRLRFITLMTCLESLFNMGRDQISHTISRHLAIILSKNRNQFKDHYAKTKKLYNIRNSIVHGGEHTGDLMHDYLELSDKVRQAINFCNQLGLTKEKLFEDLNAKGFDN